MSDRCWVEAKPIASRPYRSSSTACRPGGISGTAWNVDDDESCRFRSAGESIEFCNIPGSVAHVPAGRSSAGSMAGLLAARVLNETFEAGHRAGSRRFVWNSRPPEGVPRKPTAHSRHPGQGSGGARGSISGSDRRPGLREGATSVDILNDIAWFNGLHPPTDPSAIRSDRGCPLSRPALEHYVRGRVRGLSGVEIRGRV